MPFMPMIFHQRETFLKGRFQKEGKHASIARVCPIIPPVSSENLAQLFQTEIPSEFRHHPIAKFKAKNPHPK
jgi:hypothetical protein